MQVSNLITQVKIICGCQFTTVKLSEAQAHVAATGHGMWIQGTIQPVKEVTYGK